MLGARLRLAERLFGCCQEAAFGAVQLVCLKSSPSSKDDVLKLSILKSLKSASQLGLRTMLLLGVIKMNVVVLGELLHKKPYSYLASGPTAPSKLHCSQREVAN